MSWLGWVAIVALSAMFVGEVMMCLPDKWPRNRKRKGDEK